MAGGLQSPISHSDLINDNLDIFIPEISDHHHWCYNFPTISDLLPESKSQPRGSCYQFYVTGVWQSGRTGLDLVITCVSET